jgi:hypothetical protein
MRSEIKDLKDGVVKRVQDLELLKMDKKDAVSVDQFEPVKRLVYGCVAIMLTSVTTALIYLVVKR